MNNLSFDEQIDVLKFFNYDQLFSFKLTNYYFNLLIEQNKWILALKKLNYISIRNSQESRLKFSRSIGPIPNIVYPLDDQLLAKWQSAINAQIPLYLFNYKLNYYTDKILCLYFKDIRLKHLKLTLPNYPKNIEEMQIIRFCLEQLFLCSFEKAEFYRIMINPQIIKLLFENNKNIRFYIQKVSVYQTFLCPSTYKNQFKFISDHLIITEFIKIDFSFMDSEEVQNNLLLKLLLNSGKRIVCVYIEYIEDISIFYNLIINNIKMSTNCSEIVPYIIFGKSSCRLKMKIKADKIEIKGNEKFSFCEYTNIYNPKIKCLAKFSYCRVREPDEEIISLIEIRLIRN